MFNMVRYTVEGYDENGFLIYEESVRDIWLAYEYYRNLDTPKGILRDNLYDDPMEEFGW